MSTAPTAVPLWGPRAGKTGPVHRGRDGAYHENVLSWCGSRAQFRHRVYTGPASEVTCKACLRSIAADRPLAYGARR